MLSKVSMLLHHQLLHHQPLHQPLLITLRISRVRPPFSSSLLDNLRHNKVRPFKPLSKNGVIIATFHFSDVNV